MEVVGLIAEYNPFHNGHLYHMERALALSGADCAVVVMSGDFVQRGEPALLSKRVRAQAALEAGAALVVELPVCFAAGSAEFFAGGAVSILNGLGCVNALCFGSECGDIDALLRIAQTAAAEPEPYRRALRQYVNEGLSFPAARERALADTLGDRTLCDVLAQPNNILGIEYLKALLRQKSGMRPCTVRRAGADYHEEALGSGLCSASAVRSTLAKHGADSFDLLAGRLPAGMLRLLRETYGVRGPVSADDLSLLLKYRLLSETKESLTEYLDVTADLANRIINRRDDFTGFRQFCGLLKTKELTYARISRCLLHILLDIRAADMDVFRAQGCRYARVLGFREDCTELLAAVKEKGTIPLLTRSSQAASLPEAAQDMLRLDMRAADLYESVLTDRYGTPFVSDARQQIVIV